LPPPLARNAPPELFSAARAVEVLSDLVGDGTPHPLGGTANAKVRAAIADRLSAMGYHVQLQSGWVCNPRSGCGYPTNIVATWDRPGHADPPGSPAVLLAAHYDSVASGPGASDDGVGVAAALEIARILALPGQQMTRHGIVMLISDGEEAGLLGALLFAREHPLAKQIKAAVNMDSRGTSGPSLMFETGGANSWLMHLYSRNIERPITNSLYYVVYKLLPSDTDFSVFKAAGYQGFNFAFIGNAGFYHTPLDNLEHVSPASLQNQGSNALQALRALANTADLNAPPGDAVFFDVMGKALLVWPAAAIPVVTLSLLLLCVLEAALLVRRGAVRVREIAWGFIGFAANLMLGAALCTAALGLLWVLGKAPPFLAGPWLAHPAAMSVAAAAISLFAAACIASWLNARAGFWGLWLGAAIGIAALSAGIAMRNPGPVFPLVLAVLAALIGGLPAVASRRTGTLPRWALDWAALLPGLTLLAILLPMLLLLYSALGTFAWPPSSVAICLTCSFLLPLLAAASRPVRGFLLACAGGIAAAGLLLTWALPTYSTEWPQRVNIEYWLDATTGRAHWWVQPGSLHLPAQMAALAPFDPIPEPRFPGINQLGFSAPAPSIAEQAPRLEITASSGNHLELRLSSPRQAAKTYLVFPFAAHITEAVLNTSSGTLPVKLQMLRGGATLLAITGIPESGMAIGIDGVADFPVRVLDASYGLPAELPLGRALQKSRPENATSTQDGDLTVLGRTVRLGPAAGRGNGSNSAGSL
jgi:hypothetical protein